MLPTLLTKENDLFWSFLAHLLDSGMNNVNPRRHKDGTRIVMYSDVHKWRAKQNLVTFL